MLTQSRVGIEPASGGHINMSDIIEARPVNVHGGTFREGNAADYVRACHRSDDLNDAAKRAKGDAWGLAFSILVDCFIKAKEEYVSEPEVVHEMALADYEARIHAAKMELVHAGVYSSESVESATDKQYKANITTAMEHGIEVDKLDNSGAYAFKSMGKFNAEKKRLTDAVKAAEEERRREKALERMVKQGKADNIEDARRRVEEAAAAKLEGAEAGTIEDQGKVVVQQDEGPELSADTRAKVDAFIARLSELEQAIGSNDKLAGRLDATLDNLMGTAFRRLDKFAESSGLLAAALEDAQQHEKQAA
jgi:hypothetical protein